MAAARCLVVSQHAPRHGPQAPPLSRPQPRAGSRLPGGSGSPRRRPGPRARPCRSLPSRRHARPPEAPRPGRRPPPAAGGEAAALPARPWPRCWR
ncbi:unnamed protein product, partial [Bubo scandiacus]